MGREEHIDTAIWDKDDWRALLPPAKLLYLWSYTTSRCNWAGLYEVGRSVMTSETALTSKAVDGALGELRAGSFLFYVDGYLWVRARVKHIAARSPQMAKAIRRAVENVPIDHPLRSAFLAEYGGGLPGWGALRDELGAVERNLDTVSEGYCDLFDRSSTSTSTSSSPRSTTGNDRRAQADDDSPPAGFPVDLEPFVEPVKEILARISNLRPGALAPTTAAVARALADHPDRDFIPLAHNYEHWLTHGTGRGRAPKDVVRGFRNQLAQWGQRVAAKTPPGATVAPVVPLRGKAAENDALVGRLLRGADELERGDVA